jgi:hypothetical protein
MSDPLMQLLAELPAAALEQESAERIRSRCRTRLARSAARTSSSTSTFTPVWQLLAAALGAAYLLTAIVEALRTFRFS